MQICETGKCTGCGACANICPQKCIEMVEDDFGCIQPKISESMCIQCKKCIKTCLVNHCATSHTPLKCYAGWHLHDEARSSSASGGVAAALSETYVETGGVVYGAAFKQHQFAIVRAENKQEIRQFKGSKYVQCLTGDAYSRVREDLKNGKRVLYFGTPCQIAGLKNIVGEQKNLVTVDLICHGVPPVSYLEEYIYKKTKKHFADCTHISFRDADGWNLKVFTDEGLIYSKPHQNDLYYKAFLSGVGYRQNCYQCPYATQKRVADLTIGDFWGLGNKKPFAYAAEKVSVILVNTPRGEQALAENEQKLCLISRDISEAVEGNMQLRHPTTYSKDAEIFYTLVASCGFYHAVKKTSVQKLVRKANCTAAYSKLSALVPKKLKRILKMHFQN